MKRTKRIFALLLTMVMVMGMGVMTFAASIYNNTSNSYTVYQILTGDVAEDGETLSNIVAGSNLDTDKITAQALADALENSESADADIVAYVLEYVTGNGQTLSGGDTLSDLADGYYLIVPDNLDGSVYILQVIGSETYTLTGKTSGNVTSEKKIVDGEDLVDGVTAAIGDTITFRLTATLPSNYTDYTSYTLIFHDTLSDGFKDVKNISVTVTNDSGVTTLSEGDYEFSAELNSDGTYTITVTILNFESITNNSVVTVTYSAVLASDASTGYNSNKNEMYVTYSNNPNTSGTGNTTTDTVYVYTFDYDVTKTDENNDGLIGAGFTLYMYVGDDVEETDNEGYIAVGSEVFNEEGYTFNWSGLDVGEYKLVETTTPDGYNTMDPIYFEVTATITDDGTSVTYVISGEDSDDVEVGSDGNLDSTIVNYAGSTLPETGGMGTTILYIAGIALVLIAGVALITKKRMAR